MAYPESLTGRCTTTYPVYEKKTGRLFFLKDSWRVEGFEKESAILRELERAKVQHVPGYICGDDLPGPYGVTVTGPYVSPQEQARAPPTDAVSATSILPAPQQASPVTPTEGGNTVSGVFTMGNLDTAPMPESASWRCGNWKRIIQRYHHRMITDVIGNPLKKFASSGEMMKAVSHAFTAHRQAYVRCAVIHRDISAYNILITDEGDGVLNDWDLARFEKDIQRGRRRQHERTGTWQFMSCLLLKNKDKLHTIQDDIESFVYIVLYHSIRYLSHNKSDVLEAILDQIFDHGYHSRAGTRLGGGNKLALFNLRGYLDPFSGFEVTDHAPLNDWITKAFDLVGAWLGAVGHPKRPPPPDEDLRKLSLYEHQPMDDLFAHCLSQAGWPSDDKAVDSMRPRVAGNTTGIIRSAIESSMGSGSRNSSQKRSLLSEELDEGYEGSGSRSKPQKQRKVRSTASGSSHSFHSGMNMDNDGI